MPQFDPPPSVFPDYSGNAELMPVEPDPIVGGNATYLDPFNPAGMPERYDPFGGAYNDNLSGGGSYVGPGRSVNPTDWRDSASSNPWGDDAPRLSGGSATPFPRRSAISYTGPAGAVGDLIRRWAQQALARRALRQNAMSDQQRQAAMPTAAERAWGERNFRLAGGGGNYAPGMLSNTSTVHFNPGTGRYEYDRDSHGINSGAGGSVGGDPTNLAGSRRPQSDIGTNTFVGRSSAVRDDLGGYSVSSRPIVQGHTTPEGRAWGAQLTSPQGRALAMEEYQWLHPPEAPIPGVTSAPPRLGGYG